MKWLYKDLWLSYISSTNLVEQMLILGEMRRIQHKVYAKPRDFMVWAWYHLPRFDMFWFLVSADKDFVQQIGGEEISSETCSTRS